MHTFGTTTAELLALRDWLQSWQVTLVAMEATGVYWKPVYYVLEDEFECWLLNARHMRNVPGRKTDVADSSWIAQLVEHGLVERTREAQRLDKVLQDAGLKLSSVATDILGVSGRAILDALVSGTRDADVLAELARGRLRVKIPALREALQGRFRRHHALIVGEILAKLDYLDEAIGRLSDEIARIIDPFEPQVRLLRTIPGVEQRTADTFLAARYGRLKGRRGHPKAIVAVAHSILVTAYHMLLEGEPYTDLGAAHFVERHGAESYKHRLIANLERLGYTVTLPPAA